LICRQSKSEISSFSNILVFVFLAYFLLCFLRLDASNSFKNDISDEGKITGCLDPILPFFEKSAKFNILL